jgi:tetratricopeptide (TPR) repeat protein
VGVGAFSPDPLAGTFASRLLADHGSPVLQIQPEAVAPDQLYEVALTTAAMSFHTAAIEALRDCVAQAPGHAPAWRKLSELLRLAGDDAQADAADAAALGDTSDATKWNGGAGEQMPARLEKAENKLRKSIEGKAAEEAMGILRDLLVVEPLNAPAMRLLAQMEATSGDEITCRQLQERALDICPDYVGVRQDYAEVLVSQLAYPDAIPHTTWLVAHAPDNAFYREQHAHVLMNTGEIDEALSILNRLLRENPSEPRYWRAYARVMHFLDRRDESVQALRQCLELQPDMGEAYWAIADLKGNYFTEADITAMRAQLEGDSLQKESRVRMLFALGQALERAGDFSASFAAYDEGRRLTLAQSPGHEGPDGGEPAVRGHQHQSHAGGSDRKTDIAEAVRCRRVIFSKENLRARLVQAPAPAVPDTPIFVVGLPRAGSTLTEQILSSHSQVEGTRELPLIGDITADLNLSRVIVNRNAYPECVLQLSQENFAALGARYIERSRAYRKTNRVWFVDKRPWNWLEVGLIHLMLPQAKIIDIRREPMAACFALFKQLITKFHFDLAGLGRYYNNYVSLMEHWESVLPGVVHFIQYERLVEDTESEIRRMLDYCGLPFEEGCLRFWETDRAVATPSAQQVRRPIYRDALQQWRNFEPWLGPLKEALDQPVGI